MPSAVMINKLRQYSKNNILAQTAGFFFINYEEVIVPSEIMIHLPQSSEKRIFTVLSMYFYDF